MDIDEYFYRAIVAASSFWKTKEQPLDEEDKKDDSIDIEIKQLRERIQHLEEKETKNEELETRISKLESYIISQQTLGPNTVHADIPQDKTNFIPSD